MISVVLDGSRAALRVELDAFLRGGAERRRCGDLNEMLPLVDDADVVLVEQGPMAELVLERSRPAGQVVVAITPFGLTHPDRERPSSELVLQAESGSLATRGRPGEAPMMAGGRTTEWITGAYAAAAGLAAVLGGGDALVDISMCDVAHVAGTAYMPLLHHLGGCPTITSPARTIETVEIHPTLDGWVGMTTNSAQQFQSLLVLLERRDLLDDEELASAAGRLARSDEWSTILNGWTSVRTTAEIVERAGELRIPCAPVLDAAALLEVAHFADRGVFEPVGGAQATGPRQPWRLDGRTPGVLAPLRETVAPHRRRLPLDGVRIIDMTAWWAGPMATNVLACLGADVIHLESPRRPDGMRLTGGAFRTLGQWWERSSFFLSVNTNKRGLALDLERPEGAAAMRDLLANADVLVENFTPRVLEQLGLSWGELQDINPGLSLVRMPAFGLDGPWRDRPGFAQTMEQMSGLAWLTGWATDQPHNQRGPCDPNGGVHAAFATMCALEARRRDGRGHHVEVPFIEVALNAAAEQLLCWTAGGLLLRREGNRAPYAAPQNVYACSGDDEWLALSVESDEQWAGLLRAVPVAGWNSRVELRTHEGRRAAHDELDLALGKWAAQRSAEEAAATLSACGVPAGVVRDPRLAGTAGPIAVGLLIEQVEHPVVGEHPVPGLPFRLTSVSRWIRTPAPTLGQHNTEVLEEIGYTDEKIARLERGGVVGTLPAGL